MLSNRRQENRDKGWIKKTQIKRIKEGAGRKDKIRHLQMETPEYGLFFFYILNVDDSNHKDSLSDSI